MSIGGCDRTPEKQHDIILEKIEEISFPATGFVSINPGVIYLIESDSGDYLFVYNHVPKTFQYLKFPSGELIYETPLYFDGPHNVQGFTGGRPIGQDSIWITFYPPAIGLINFKGELLSKKKIDNDLFRVTTLGTGSQTPLIRHGTKIFGAQPYFMNHHGMDKKDIEKHQLIYSYDYLSDSAQWYDVFYPKDYWDLGKKLTYYSWAEREGKIYIAPYYDHEMQVFDMATEAVAFKKQVKSSTINRFNHVNVLPASPHEAIINTLKSDRYGGLYYDQYRDVFYRIFIPGFEPNENASLEELRHLDKSRKRWGIMVLDKDLNILAEHFFKDFEAYPDANFLVGRKGLYVSMNNLFHPGYEEDRFRHMLMTLDTIDESKGLLTIRKAK